MKLVAKCSASVSLSDQVHVKVCNPIPLIQAQWISQTLAKPKPISAYSFMFRNAFICLWDAFTFLCSRIHYLEWNILIECKSGSIINI